MSFTFQYYSNTAPNTLTGAVNATVTTFPVSVITAPWNGPFPYVIAIDRGLTTQEVCLVTNYSAGLVVTRNYDGNGAFGHSNTSTPSIEFIAPASDWANFNLHTTDPSRDDHTKLMKSDGTRHNLAANHQLGVNIPTGTPSNSSPGDTQADGTGGGLARADHTHGRTDSYATYLGYLHQVGLILPLPSGSPPANTLLCNGGWYNQADYAALFAKIGGGFTPAPITNPGTATNPFNPVIHFATPTMGTYTNGTLSWLFGTQWVILA